MITFGFELEMLMLHMRIMQPEVAGFFVAEATSTYEAINQGQLKPSKAAVLSEALGNGTFPADLANLVTVRVLHAMVEVPRCKVKREVRVVGPHGCWEARHRQALVELLLAVAMDDDLALLADVDEIASPQVVRLLRRCAVLQSAAAPEAPQKVTLQAYSVMYGVHCWPGEATWFAPHVFSVSWLRRRFLYDSPPMSAIAFLDTRAHVRHSPLALDAAWHFTSVGAPWQLQRKLRTWGHANLYAERNYPGSLDLARLERCQRLCLQSNAVAAPGSRVAAPGTRAPPCFSRAGRGADRRLPGVLLTNATLSHARFPAYLLEHRSEHQELFRYL